MQISCYAGYDREPEDFCEFLFMPEISGMNHIEQEDGSVPVHCTGCARPGIHGCLPVVLVKQLHLPEKDLTNRPVGCPLRQSHAVSRSSQS